MYTHFKDSICLEALGSGMIKDYLVISHQPVSRKDIIFHLPGRIEGVCQSSISNLVTAANVGDVFKSWVCQKIYEENFPIDCNSYIDTGKMVTYKMYSWSFCVHFIYVYMYVYFTYYMHMFLNIVEKKIQWLYTVKTWVLHMFYQFNVHLIKHTKAFIMYEKHTIL